jgi:hypothetical protein
LNKSSIISFNSIQTLSVYTGYYCFAFLKKGFIFFILVYLMIEIPVYQGPDTFNSLINDFEPYFNSYKGFNQFKGLVNANGS